MAAPSTVQKGLDYTLRVADGTVVGGGKNATLTQNQEYRTTTNKGSSEWRTGLSGTRSWSVSFDGEFLESSNEIGGDTLDCTIGGTSIKGITEITVDLSVDLIPVVNSSNTAALDRELCPATRSATITVTGDWFDYDLDSVPTGGDEALEDAKDAIDGTSTAVVAAVVSFGSNQQFSGNYRPGSLEVSTPHDGLITYSLTLENVGATTNTTTGADTGIAALLADFFDASGVQEVGTALLSTGTTDSVEWTGSAYPENLSVTMTEEGTVQFSGTLQGSGALTTQATA